MQNLIQKFIYFILAIQEKTLNKSSGRKMRTSFSHSTSKHVYAKGSSLTLTGKTEKNKERLKQDVSTILKKYENDPEKLLKFIKKNGTCVYKIPFADFALKLLGREEGFVGALKGFEALYLSLFVSVMTKGALKPSFSTEAMFVLKNQPANKYYMIQQFHKWYAMKLDLPGFDDVSQEKFQKFLNSSSDNEIKALSMDEIIGLKEAIARDVEAINFVIELAKATDGSKKALQKLTAGGATI